MFKLSERKRGDERLADRWMATDYDDEGIVYKTLELEGTQNLHVICTEKNTDWIQIIDFG